MDLFAVVPFFAGDVPKLPVRSGELLANFRFRVVGGGPVQVLAMLGGLILRRKMLRLRWVTFDVAWSAVGAQRDRWKR
jgi:hypothetical protein